MSLLLYPVIFWLMRMNEAPKWCFTVFIIALVLDILKWLIKFAKSYAEVSNNGNSK